MPLQRELSHSPLPQGEGLGVRARPRDIAKPVSLTPDKLFRTLLREGGNPCPVGLRGMGPRLRGDEEIKSLGLRLSPVRR